jgi:hypothetical protein
MNETNPTNASEVEVAIVNADVTGPAMPTGVISVITLENNPVSHFAFFGTRIRETAEAFKEAF